MVLSWMVTCLITVYLLFHKILACGQKKSITANVAFLRGCIKDAALSYPYYNKKLLRCQPVTGFFRIKNDIFL